ncbi:MAG: AEC family transporter [Bacillota bacterium]|nr:AEC family transporter [Bacillota bacterium]
MDIALNVTTQVVIIFLLMAVGFVLSKMKIVTETGVKQMTDILLFVVTPCVLVNSYQDKIADFSQNLILGLAAAAVFSILIHLIAIIIATLYFKKEPTGNYKVNIFATIYSNCGFMAIPLLQAVLGKDGVFYGSAYLVVFTILYWTQGLCVFSGSRKSLSVKKLLLTPGIIGSFVALILFLLRIELPYILKDTIERLSTLNTPLSMVVLGTYLAKINLKKAFCHKPLYSVLFFRLLLIPIISIFVLWAINRVYPMSEMISQSVLIPSACPVAAVAALFAAKYGNDASYASELVAISTLVSIITIPLIMAFSALFI